MTDPTPRDLIAEWLATDIDIVDDAYRNQADDLIDTLEAAGWHITHDPAAHCDRQAQAATERAEKAEAAVARVRALAERYTWISRDIILSALSWERP